ncbi:hypothetical protein MRB53_001648 [Persea americana]|uniref:Uncharacterized protein n=1 Tax=Persea americana TaxID=3435 RepID=A0ACC2MSB4_PERAE|nr:hypothetical protein MRB53_001648 [Persea americana]
MDSAISKVTDACLSSLFHAMFDTLTPSFLQTLDFLFGIEGEAQKLKSTLSRIQALLNDAEDRQIREESVRLWLRELKDAAYDAEDIVDQVEYQVLRFKIGGAQMQTRKRKLTDPREGGWLVESDGDSSAANSGIQVVPICGMGGLGKTTLARLAYNDEHVVEHFEVRSWVYVSQDFDLIKLTKAIAESVPGSNPHLTNLNAIQVSIKEALKEKRFLLVLDDVWTEDFDDWHKLRAPLMFGARGSRILVTTRSRRVSSNMGTRPTRFLQGLSKDDSWSLFERRAFVDGDSDAHPDLVKIGKEIVKKVQWVAFGSEDTRRSVTLCSRRCPVGSNLKKRDMGLARRKK